MGLPNWTDSGTLPLGIHACDMADVYERFVEDAPQRPHREVLYAALSTYMMLLKHFIPSGKAWIDGGFSTRKGTAPHDVDVVVLPGDWSDLEGWSDQEAHDFMGLLTLQDVIIGSFDPPGWWERLQPIGGALDSFLCYPGQEKYWQGIWASVKGDDGRNGKPHRGEGELHSRRSSRAND